MAGVRAVFYRRDGAARGDAVRAGGVRGGYHGLRASLHTGCCHLGSLQGVRERRAGRTSGMGRCHRERKRPIRVLSHYGMFTLPDTDTDKKWVVYNCVEVFILHRHRLRHRLLLIAIEHIFLSVSVPDSVNAPLQVHLVRTLLSLWMTDWLPVLLRDALST